MTGIEILKKYPLSTEIIKAWFLDKMIKSMRSSEITEEFKKYLEEKSIQLTQIADLIDINPRILFDLFDEHKIYINIIRDFETFEYNIVGIDPIEIVEFNTRKKAELEAIISAFIILEEQLFINEEQTKFNEIDYPNSQE